MQGMLQQSLNVINVAGNSFFQNRSSSVNINLVGFECMECPLEAARQHTELPNGYGMGEGKVLTWPSFCSNSFHANIYQPPTEACGALCLYYRPNVAQSFRLFFGVLK